MSKRILAAFATSIVIGAAAIGTTVVPRIAYAPALSPLTAQC